MRLHRQLTPGGSRLHPALGGVAGSLLVGDFGSGRIIPKRRHHYSS